MYYQSDTLLVMQMCTVAVRFQQSHLDFAYRDSRHSQSRVRHRESNFVCRQCGTQVWDAALGRRSGAHWSVPLGATALPPHLPLAGGHK